MHEQKIWNKSTAHTVEKKLICHFSAITAVTSFVRNIGYQRNTGVLNFTRSEQKDLEKIKFREEKALEDRVS